MGNRILEEAVERLPKWRKRLFKAYFTPEAEMEYRSMVFCEHANENPDRVCTCPPNCGCREFMCKEKLEARCPMKVILFTGSREISKDQLPDLIEELIDIKATSQPDLVIVGCATGVDSIVRRTFEPKVAQFRADWKKFRKAAGAIRNQEMVRAAKLLGCKKVYGYPGENSIGTWDCVRKALTAGMRVYLKKV